MAPPDPTLQNDELLLREAIAAADRLHDKPRCWMARFGGYLVQNKALIPGLAEYRRIVKDMDARVKSKRVKAESAKW